MSGEYAFCATVLCAAGVWVVWGMIEDLRAVVRAYRRMR